MIILELGLFFANFLLLMYAVVIVDGLFVAAPFIFFFWRLFVQAPAGATFLPFERLQFIQVLIQEVSVVVLALLRLLRFARHFWPEQRSEVHAAGLLLLLLIDLNFLIWGCMFPLLLGICGDPLHTRLGLALATILGLATSTAPLTTTALLKTSICA